MPKNFNDKVGGIILLHELCGLSSVVVLKWNRGIASQICTVAFALKAKKLRVSSGACCVHIICIHLCSVGHVKACLKAAILIHINPY